MFVSITSERVSVGIRKYVERNVLSSLERTFKFFFFLFLGFVRQLLQESPKWSSFENLEISCVFYYIYISFIRSVGFRVMELTRFVTIVIYCNFSVLL